MPAITLAEALSNALRAPGDAPFLLHRDFPESPYRASSYNEVADAAAALSAGLSAAGIERRAMVGIASKNCPEWLISDFACAFGDFVNVGLHLEWGAAKLSDVIARAEVQCIIVSDSGLSTIREALATSLPKPILIRMPPNGVYPKREDDVLEWEDLLTKGKHLQTTHTGFGFEDDVAQRSTICDAQEDETAPYTLMFSSGTSGGPPKAVVCSKKGWRSSNCNAGAFANMSDLWDRRAVSYLSLAHGADRGIAWQAAFASGTIGFARGEADLDGCLQDLAELRPTFFLGMASFFCALFQRHTARLTASVDKHLWASVLAACERSANEAGAATPRDAESLCPTEWAALRKAFLATRRGGFIRREELDHAREEMGGQLLCAVTGGSRTPEPVLQFMHFLLADGNSSAVKDAYGLTEFPGIAVNGNVNEDVELKLVASGQYSPDDVPCPRGEIVVRRRDGEQSRIWRDAGKTAAAWDEEGWFHTGDIGELSWHQLREPNSCHERRAAAGHAWTPQSSLRVIDRVSQLEELYVGGDSVWVAAQRLETEVYGALPGLERVVLAGDRNEGALVALLCPRPRRAAPLSCAEWLALLQARGRVAGAMPHEIPVGVVVADGPWTEQEGLITMTGKVNRAAVKQRYHSAWSAVLARAVAKSPGSSCSGGPASSLAGCDAHVPRVRESVASEAGGGGEDEGRGRLGAVVAALAGKLEAEADADGGEWVDRAGLPLAMPRGRRKPDCRVRRVVRRVTQVEVEGGGQETLEEEVEEAGTESVETVRGRDWLADREVRAGERERRFEISGLCARDGGAWEKLEAGEAEQLKSAVAALREEALQIRGEGAGWKAVLDAQRREAAGWVEAAVEDMRQAVQQAVAAARAGGEVAGIGKALLQGKRAVERGKQRQRRVRPPGAQGAAFERLERAMREVKAAGDLADVNMAALPVCWRLDLDWVFDAWRQEQRVVACPFGCKRHVLERRLGEHITVEGCCEVGVTDAPVSAAQGTAMGGDTEVECELSGATVDPEDCDLLEPLSPSMTPEERSRACPVRRPRYHGLATGRSRLPWAHEALQEAWALATRAPRDREEALALLRRSDPSPDEVFVRDKQGPFWLLRYVKFAQPGEQPSNTPASLITRACDAFADRPALGIPNLATEQCVRRHLPRRSSLDVLPAAAGVALEEIQGYRWLKYRDLGVLLKRVARGLAGLGLPLGSFVAISGYNDLEFAVADFAVAAAGMVSVPIHGTFNSAEAASLLHKVGCVALACMSDHACDSERLGRWSVESLVANCKSLAHIIYMDSPPLAVRNGTGPPAASGASSDRGEGAAVGKCGVRVSSFLEWVSPAADAALLGAIPDPFEARGAPYTVLSGGEGTSESSRVSTVLFTSGSTGSAKAVAVGVSEFCADVMGSKGPEETGTARSITASYIPLSHGSDRYKLWSHAVHGGRVGFCFYGAEHWAWREAGKSGLAGESPVALLFQQVALLRPTSMALPPNIWGGLRSLFDDAVAAGSTPNQAMTSVAALFGQPSRVTTLATGGAPTPASDMAFATKLCRRLKAKLSNSYGTTESGALTVDGRQPHPKYSDVEVQLINSGCFTLAKTPLPRGEVVVSCQRLALGYLGDAEKSRNSFFVAGPGAPHASSQPALQDTSHLAPGRWYRTGDLGCFDHTGRLLLLGRVSTECVRGVPADELESVVESEVGGARLVCIFNAEERPGQRREDCEAAGDTEFQVVCVVNSRDESAELVTSCKESIWRKIGSKELAVSVLVDTTPWTPENFSLSASRSSAAP